jgi:hypothetical protein
MLRITIGYIYAEKLDFWVLFEDLFDFSSSAFPVPVLRQYTDEYFQAGYSETAPFFRSIMLMNRSDDLLFGQFQPFQKFLQCPYWLRYRDSFHFLGMFK